MKVVEIVVAVLRVLVTYLAWIPTVYASAYLLEFHELDWWTLPTLGVLLTVGVLSLCALLRVLLKD